MAKENATKPKDKETAIKIVGILNAMKYAVELWLFQPILKIITDTNLERDEKIQKIYDIIKIYMEEIQREKNREVQQ